MDLITFRCAACKAVLKIGADKAGRKAKCKCGAELTIPLVSEDLATAATTSAPAAVHSTAVDQDEDGPATGYGLAPEREPEAEKPKEQPKEQKATPKPQDEEEQERKRRRRAAMRKAPLDPVAWEKARMGILLVVIATSCSIMAFALQRAVLPLGMLKGPEYAADAEIGMLVAEDQSPAPGEDLELDRTRFVIGLLVGSDRLDLGLWLMRIGQAFILLQGLTAIAGCAICLAVPSRFGTRGLLVACLSVATLNLILQVVFKLLPLFGAWGYTMIPLLAPEVAMTMANVNRQLPIAVYWSDAPFWEFLAALVVQMLYCAEPVLFCLFLRAVALQIRDERLQALANALILMALGTAFALLAYYLLSVTGTSDVLGWVLRVVYGLWAAFFLAQLIWYDKGLQTGRQCIAAKLAEEE
jgi:hypothetical protein